MGFLTGPDCLNLEDTIDKLSKLREKCGGEVPVKIQIECGDKLLMVTYIDFPILPCSSSEGEYEEHDDESMVVITGEW